MQIISNKTIINLYYCLNNISIKVKKIILFISLFKKEIFIVYIINLLSL